MENNKLGESDAGIAETDVTSESHGEKRTPWVIASEVAGIEGMPTTDRRARDELERLSAGKDGVKRKRSGTKAFEYHASILPQYVLDELEKRGLFPDGINVEHQTPSSTPYEPTKITLTGVNEHATVYSAFLDEFALIPGYLVQVSAGHGALVQGEKEPYQHLPFPRKWLRKRGFYEDELAIVWCKGDSMEPTISDSATLVVHLGRTRPIDGRIYVVRNDDQLWVKRLQVRPDAWVLISDNAIYPPMTIKKHEQHTFEVIGQVVHIAHDVGE